MRGPAWYAKYRLPGYRSIIGSMLLPAFGEDRNEGVCGAQGLRTATAAAAPGLRFRGSAADNP